MRKRPVLFATIAVVLLGAAGATSVFVVGSRQRRDDRKAYLAYERLVLAPVGAVRDVAEEMRRGVGGADLVAEWKAALARARATFIRLEAPSFLGDVEEQWVDAVDAYVRVADERLNPRPGGSRLLQRADDLYFGAARLMQFHRRRLGLQALAAPKPMRSVFERDAPSGAVSVEK